MLFPTEASGTPSASLAGPESQVPLPRHRGPVERAHRLRTNGHALLGTFDNRLPFRVVDVSETGMCVETSRPMPYQSASARFEGDVVVGATVVWSKLVQVGPEGPRYRSGLQFREPTFEQIRALLALATA